MSSSSVLPSFSSLPRGYTPTAHRQHRGNGRGVLFAGVSVQNTCTGKQTHLCAGQGLLGTGPKLEGVKLPNQVDEGFLGCPEPQGHGDPALAEGHGDPSLGITGLHTSLIKHLLLITDTSKKHLPSARISNTGASPPAGLTPWKPRGCGEAAGQGDTAPYTASSCCVPWQQRLCVALLSPGLSLWLSPHSTACEGKDVPVLSALAFLEC